MSTIKERPILFSAPMVRAILAGSKTQTRRVVKLREFQPSDTHGYDWTFRDKAMRWHDYRAADLMARRCPYGKPGDSLWVRETLSVTRHWRQIAYAADDATLYQANQSVGDPRAEALIDRYGTGNFEESRGVPSIHMPRWACRLVLEITEMRVERLQDISEADALAEGCRWVGCNGDREFYSAYSPSPGVKIDVFNPTGAPTAREAFANLWESINGAGSWDANPWVWAVSFKRIEGAAP